MTTPGSRSRRSTPTSAASRVVGFVERALSFYAGLGITPERLQTDNAFIYTKNTALRELLSGRGIRHRTIPPRTPKRNGKVERYQQTLAHEWAYGKRYTPQATHEPQRSPSG